MVRRQRQYREKTAPEAGGGAERGRKRRYGHRGDESFLGAGGGFNPCINWGCGEHCHEPLIQSTLIRTNVDMEFENDLATDYSVSEDGLTWTFHIRDDVKFTDGEPADGV